MSEQPAAAADERYASWLVACDEALAVGGQSTPLDSVGVPAELRRRLGGDLRCLRWVRRMFPPGPGGGPPAVVPVAAVAEGEFGRFRIRRSLGAGAYGEVFLAYDPRLRREVALKVPRPEVLLTPGFRDRFLREARAAAGLDHPNLVPVYEADTVGAVCFIAAAYCPGPTLAAWLRERQEPVPWDTAAQLVGELARAIEHAHQRGVLHRDLKPSNVLLAVGQAVQPDSSAGVRLDSLTYVPKITDFGLAKVAEDTAGGVPGSDGLTRTGAILGTPAYMAPEQAAGRAREVGVAADVYALGVILYELLAGTPPFRGETVLDTLEQVRTREPVPPTRLRPRLPRDVETICLKCLRKEPHQRYDGAAALADDLERFLAGRPVLARRTGALERGWRWCRRNPALAALTGCLAVLVAVVIVGTALSAWWLRAETTRAQYAERDATVKLLESSFTRAQTTRRTGRMGQRFESLEALQEAARLARLLGLEDEYTLRLRGEAITCLALADLHVVQHWRDEQGWDTHLTLDADLERYVCRLGSQGDLSVRRRADRREVFRLPGPGREVSDIIYPRFSADDRFFGVTYGFPDGGRRWALWELRDGHTARQVLAVDGATFFAFSPDSRRVAVSLPDGWVRLHDLAGGGERRLGPDLRALHMAFSPDGRQLALVLLRNNTAVEVLDVQTNAVVAWFPNPAEVHALAWSPDGRLLAAGCDDRNVHVWDVPRRQEQAVLEGHQKQVWSVCFHPSGNLLASWAGDSTTRLWDPVSGRCLVTAPGLGLHFSPDGRRMGFREGIGTGLGVWEVADGRECRLLHHGQVGNRVAWLGHKGPETVEFSPDGRLLVTPAGDGVRLWDAATARELAHLPIGHHEAAVFHPRGDRLFTHGRAGLHSWPIRPALAGGLQVGPPETLGVPPGKGWFRLACSGDGRFLAATDEAHQRVLVVDLQRPAERVVLPDCPKVINLTFRPKGEWVAAGFADTNGVKVWDRATGRVVWRTPNVGGFVAFTPDGDWLVEVNPDAYRLWRSGSWRAGTVLPRANATVWTAPIAFARDRRVAALLPSFNRLRLIDLTGSRELATFSGPGAPCLVWLSFSPDGGQLAAAAEDHTVQLWDLRRVRGQLAALGLDWDLPELPPRRPGDRVAPGPVQVYSPDRVARPAASKPFRVPGALEGETLDVVHWAGCTRHVQEMWPWGDGWSDGRQLFVVGKEGSYVEVAVRAARAGRYGLTVYFTRADNYGCVEVCQGGKRVGKPFDGFGPSVVPSGPVDFGTVELREGVNRLRFTVVGKNPSSFGYLMGLDCLVLTPFMC
jgi:WD40 repeat protein